MCFGATASQRLYTGTLLSPFALTAALAVALGSVALLLPLALLPGFANPPGNYTLAPDSGLIDAGHPQAPTPARPTKHYRLQVL